jgi:hypothetical protein
MSIKLITTIKHDTNAINTIKVYYNSALEEYMVIPVINGINDNEITWYYTDNKKDALNTANAILKGITQ